MRKTRNAAALQAPDEDFAPEVNGPEVAENLTGWPLDRRERGDFYHRPRLFPQEVKEWRERLVEQVLGAPRRFPGVPKGSDVESVRALIDEGVSFVREVARLLALLYGGATGTSVPAALDDETVRVLSRINPFRELGLDFARMEDSDRRSLLELLVPPNLRTSLSASAQAHAKAHCLAETPECGGCEVRNFCAFYRRAQQRKADESGAPVVVDLFTGAGGLSEGFVRAGFHLVVASDWDATALKTHWLNHPATTDEGFIVGDVRELAASRIRKLLGKKKLDVLIGAPPCQGFSSAGFRSKSQLTGWRAIADERNYLFENLVELALELKPRLFLMENVPGMQSAKKENLSFLETAASILESKGGYRTAVWRLNAVAFGVPQDRSRFFLVASLDSPLPPPPAEDYQNNRRGDFDVDALPPVNFDEATFDLPPQEAGKGTAVARWERTVPADAPRHRRYLRKFNLLGSSALVYNHGARYQNERDLELYALLKPGEDSVHAIERYGREDLMRYRRDVFDDKYARLRGDRPSKTIVAHLAKDGNGYIHPVQTRSITPREAARLQSFHDRYVFCGSPSDQWVQIGNAVPPVMAQAIAGSFMSTLRRVKK